MGIYAGVPLEPEVVKCHGACKPLFFPCGPCGLYSRDFRQPMLPHHAPAAEVCVCKGSRGRRAERGRFLHKEGQCPGEAQPERTLLRSHAAHLKPCATATLQCVWSCWASPAYKCSHHRLVSTRDVAAALNISFPQRHCKDC